MLKGYEKQALRNEFNLCTSFDDALQFSCIETDRYTAALEFWHHMIAEEQFERAA